MAVAAETSAISFPQLSLAYFTVNGGFGTSPQHKHVDNPFEESLLSRAPLKKDNK